MEHTKKTSSSSSKNKLQLHIGRSKTNTTATPVICKKHPKHRQSAGVCAVCLREKLAQFTSSTSASTSRNKTKKNVISSCTSSSLSSLSSSHCSSKGSSCTSPIYHRTYNKSKWSSTTFLRSGKNVFMKSKSMASLTQRQGVLDLEVKKEGFWSKLLRPRRKGTNEGLMHSKTMREREFVARVSSESEQ